MLPSIMRKKTESDRFWEKVGRRSDDECWEWSAYKLQGYGRFGVGGSRANGGRIVYAHRWAYEALVGPIPEGLTLDHLCRNRACVNPEHLEPVTPQENTRRGAILKTHCPQGHPYSGENLFYGTDGSRRCRECNRLQCERRARQTGIQPVDARTHCGNGHAWTDENTYRSPNGHRHCRACGRDAAKRYYKRKQT